tara:strand:+ start:391 stop:786 length:396 start_codon:yes stop_codon:yes gene_type:complete
MYKIVKELLSIVIVYLSFIYILSPPILEAIDMDLSAAKNSVGERFVTKFCEAKKEGVSLESSSDFALNNTYLKFVTFPDDEKFIKDLLEFTIGRIRNECGDYVIEKEETVLRDFIAEEVQIASNRDLYLPN